MDVTERSFDATLSCAAAVLEYEQACLQFCTVDGMDCLRQFGHPASLPACAAVACLAARCVPYRREDAVEGFDVTRKVMMVVPRFVIRFGGEGSADGACGEQGGNEFSVQEGHRRPQ
ncbi:MAG TPA: hypothetical protein PKM62_05135 [Azospira sp.]|nr:hypothetical protein [Azospira sp.]HNN45277.1 hypothetical protein [Azospira sp.]